MQVSEYHSKFESNPGIDNPIAILRDMNNNEEFNDDEVFFYTKDHLGSIRELVGLDGKLKQRQRYTAYGVTTREKNTDQLDRLIDHAYGFTSRELDSETGLYFYRARYYQPSDYVGRFISEDPIGLKSGDRNLYGYVTNSPLNKNDPYGLWGFFGGSGGTFGAGGSDTPVRNSGCNFVEGSSGLAYDFASGKIAGFAGAGIGQIFGATLSAGPFAGVFFGDLSTLKGEAANTSLVTPAGTLTFTYAGGSLISVSFGRGGLGTGFGISNSTTNTSLGSFNGGSTGGGALPPTSRCGCGGK